MEYYKEVKKTDGRVLRPGGPRDIQRMQRIGRDSTYIINELKKQVAILQTQAPISTVAGPAPEEIDEEIRKAVRDAVKETKQHYKDIIADLKEKENKLLRKMQETSSESNKKMQNGKIKYKKEYNEKVEKLEEKYNNKISRLEDGLKIAEERLVVKDETIEILHTEKDSTIKKLIEEQIKMVEELARSVAGGEGAGKDSQRPQMEEVFVDPLEADAGKGLESHINVKDISIDEQEKMAEKVDKLRDLMAGLKR